MWDGPDPRPRGRPALGIALGPGTGGRGIPGCSRIPTGRVGEHHVEGAQPAEQLIQAIRDDVLADDGCAGAVELQEPGDDGIAFDGEDLQACSEEGPRVEAESGSEVEDGGRAVRPQDLRTLGRDDGPGCCLQAVTGQQQSWISDAVPGSSDVTKGDLLKCGGRALGRQGHDGAQTGSGTKRVTIAEVPR